MKKRVGIIDSGIGGLTLLQEMISLGLDAEYFYISDQDNVPYGGKTQKFMFSQAGQMLKTLKEKKVEGVLLACNTLTVETINQLRQQFAHPIVGIVPYINYINKEAQPHDNLAMILTPATYKSEGLQQLQEKFDSKKNIKIYPLNKLAMLIESLKEKDFSIVRPEIDNELDQLKGKGYSHLILGCTHYPIIKTYIEKYLDIISVNPHKNVIDRLVDVLELARDQKPSGKFWYQPKMDGTWKELNIRDLSFLTL